MNEAYKRVLGLQLPTDPRWVDMAQMSLQAILSDHAYCEQKAATACISLIQGFSDKAELVEKLAPIVTEEWGHFRAVLDQLKKRGLHLGRQRKDEYVNALLKFIRKGQGPERALLDKLLICAMIEARSCERFRLLSIHLAEEEMRTFYRKFMLAEAGHYRLFIELAETYFSEEEVQVRWKKCLAFEAALLQELEPRGDRMH